MDRAAAFEAEGRGFESLQARQAGAHVFPAGHSVHLIPSNRAAESSVSRAQKEVQASRPVRPFEGAPCAHNALRLTGTECDNWFGAPGAKQRLI